LSAFIDEGTTIAVWSRRVSGYVTEMDTQQWSCLRVTSGGLDPVQATIISAKPWVYRYITDSSSFDLRLRRG
jgi:hypothetical protein